MARFGSIYDCISIVSGYVLRLATHKLAVQAMLFDHNAVDGFGVFECEEAEPARTTGGAITHYLAIDDFAELREVVFEGFYLMC